MKESHLPSYLLCLLIVGSVGACRSSSETQPNLAPTSSLTTTRTISLPEIREAYSSAASQFVDLEGTELHYQASGNGPTLLLIHGTLGDVRDWDEWAAILDDHYRVVRLDLPGFGLSSGIPNDNYSIDRTLATIDALMDHLDEPSFAIVGISYGGIVAFRYAATRVDRVSALVLMNSAGIQTGKRPAKAKKTPSVNTPKAKNIFVDANVFEEDVNEFYRAYINDPVRRDREFVQRKLDFLNVVGRDMQAQKSLRLYERGNPTQVLSHVRAPSLVIWGGGNKALDTTTALAFKNALSNACFTRLVTFPKGGHYINVELPRETAAAGQLFFEEVANAYDNNSCGHLRVSFKP
ncbi:MAG: alpha/beta fold hydrolase [Gammaproteobacteria bacterium]